MGVATHSPAPGMREALEALIEQAVHVGIGQSIPGMDVSGSLQHLVTTAEALRSALSAPQPAPSVREDDLLFRRRDIERGLILFRTSNNSQGYTNFVSLTAKVDALPQVAKDELAGMMRNIAHELSPPSHAPGAVEALRQAPATPVAPEPAPDVVEAACRAYNEHRHGKGCPVWEEEHPPMRAALAAALLQAQAARIAELEAGLEPFARHIDEMRFDLDNKGNPRPDDETVGWVYVTNGDFRRARSLLSKEGRDNG